MITNKLFADFKSKGVTLLFVRSQGILRGPSFQITRRLRMSSAYHSADAHSSRPARSRSLLKSQYAPQALNYLQTAADLFHNAIGKGGLVRNAMINLYKGLGTFPRSAGVGIRVDAAIHCITPGKRDRPVGASLRPMPVTMAWDM